jgi:hypothetical protein
VVSGRGVSVPDAHVGIHHTNGVPAHRFSRRASADLKPLPEGDGPCGDHGDRRHLRGEQFDSIAVRLTRWLTFRQTATRSCGPNLAAYGPIAGPHGRPAGATFTL